MPLLLRCPRTMDPSGVSMCSLTADFKELPARVVAPLASDTSRSSPVSSAARMSASTSDVRVDAAASRCNGGSKAYCMGSSLCSLASRACHALKLSGHAAMSPASLSSP